MDACADQDHDLEASEETLRQSPLLLGVPEEAVNDLGELVASRLPNSLQFFL